MAEIMMTKTPSGALIPSSEHDSDKLRKIKVGAVVRCEISEMRNGAFFRKWWSLAKFAFDIWADGAPRAIYKGNPVQHSFDRFRKDLIILTGRHHAVFSALGEMRLEADSISWSRMNEDAFEGLYSETINVILEKILTRPDITEEQLRSYCDRVMQYD